jgi:hypothetical protein
LRKGAADRPLLFFLWECIEDFNARLPGNVAGLSEAGLRGESPHPSRDAGLARCAVQHLVWLGFGEQCGRR